MKPAEHPFRSIEFGLPSVRPIELPRRDRTLPHRVAIAPPAPPQTIRIDDLRNTPPVETRRDPGLRRDHALPSDEELASGPTLPFHIVAA